MKSERGEISVAVILLLTFLSGLGITVFGVTYDHHLREEEARERQARMQAEQNINWSEKDYELK